ncbi:uncharacterized protein LOC132276752 [Cornus florida]|uniref:uncharacterized protein LOC132276752 n=1 Tax=Cornus florida TaxID=4283 RepID=UPI002896E7F1|nr:uncharacterized protein LOC132276752 [Cornus florida]
MFKELFYEKYFPVAKRWESRKQFDDLIQGNMSVTEYENKFTSLSCFAPEIVKNEADKTRKKGIVEAREECRVIFRGQSWKRNRGGPSQFQGQQSARSAPTTPIPTGSARSGVVCFHYNQSGHYKAKCPQASASSGVYFGCGQKSHRVKDCPNRGAGTGSGRGLQQKPSQSVIVQSGVQVGSSLARVPQGRVFALAQTDASSSLSVLRVGVLVSLSRVMRDYSIVIARRTFVFDLILLVMTNFDVILGMDWLALFRATIDCFRGRVTVCIPEGDCFFFMGDRSDSHTSSFYRICGRGRGDYFLVSLLAEEDGVVEEVYPTVVHDFLDVFPKDLTELPPY